MIYAAAFVAIIVAADLDYRRRQRRARDRVRAFYGNTVASTRRPFPK